MNKSIQLYRLQIPDLSIVAVSLLRLLKAKLGEKAEEVVGGEAPSNPQSRRPRGRRQRRDGRREQEDPANRHFSGHFNIQTTLQSSLLEKCLLLIIT